MYTYICTICVTGIPEGENEAKAVFVVIVAEKFAKYTKEIKPQIEEMLMFLNRVNIHKTTTMEHQNKRFFFFFFYVCLTGLGLNCSMRDLVP